MKFNTTYKKLLADTLTPVQIYLKLRDEFPMSILLESSAYKGMNNHFSYICANPIAGFEITDNRLMIRKHRTLETFDISKMDISKALREFTQSFTYKGIENVPFKTNGLFGYIAYDASSFLNNAFLQKQPGNIPSIHFQVFRNVIVVNHYHGEIYIFDHLSEKESNVNQIISLLNNRSLPHYHFLTEGKETSNYTDAEFLQIIKKGISHCQKRDIRQIVLSRKFRRKFKGDDFNLYRALRSINPSPYLFYFDYGKLKVFGSSPEAQLIVDNGQANVRPIAGTFKKTGHEEKDRQLAEKLKSDHKENTEHKMLVEQAIEELRQNSGEVQVENYCKIEYFSHVIHLVSEVTAKLASTTDPIKVLIDTYPAGTLSGAPKPKAMELIDEYENESRGVYGGCIGMLGFDGFINMAIVIRSFISRNQHVEYQAGAGIIAESIPESEHEEINNKLGALRDALKLAETI